MAPPDLVAALGPWGPHLAAFGAGTAFGFVLERAGFGDSRRLAAQFYLHDQRVLRVMFTAIAVACALTLAASAWGGLDLARVEVPATYLGSAVVGGLLLGMGFLVGGYCPGTSIVSAATLKADGALFLLGATLGAFAFGETVDAYADFYEGAGARGRLTLPDWLGLPPGLVGLGVVVLALGAFAGAGWLERRFAHLDPERAGAGGQDASSGDGDGHGDGAAPGRPAGGGPAGGEAAGTGPASGAPERSDQTASGGAP